MNEGIVQGNLKKHGAVWLQADSFAVRKCKQLVIVHDRVHVLDPKGVHVTIINCVATLLLLCWFVDFAEDVGQQTVRPITRYRV